MWANLWPYYGFLCKWFSLYIKVYQGWALQQSSSTDPPKENGRTFVEHTTVEFPIIAEVYNIVHSNASTLFRLQVHSCSGFNNNIETSNLL